MLLMDTTRHPLMVKGFHVVDNCLGYCYFGIGAFCEKPWCSFRVVHKGYSLVFPRFLIHAIKSFFENRRLFPAFMYGKSNNPCAVLFTH